MIQVFIEAAAGSQDRQRYDEKTLKLKSTGHGAHPYPFPYGFIIGTSGPDGDAVDCYIITQKSVQPGSAVECEPLGLLEQDEDGEIDHKILAAIPGENIALNDDVLTRLRNFIYAIFAEIPGARVRVGDLLPRETALDHIQKYRVA